METVVKQTDFSEQRQWQRIPAEVEVKWRDKDSVFTPFRRTELMDIHHQGCRLLGGLHFKRGKVVSMLVDLPDEGPCYLEGVVAWSAPVYQNRIFETGVRFLTEDRTSEDVYVKLFHYCLIHMPR